MERLHLFAGFTILNLWSVTVIDGIITGDYEGLDLTTPVMLVFAGYLFGHAVFRKGRNGNGNGIDGG